MNRKNTNWTGRTEYKKKEMKRNIKLYTARSKLYSLKKTLRRQTSTKRTSITDRSMIIHYLLNVCKIPITKNLLHSHFPWNRWKIEQMIINQIFLILVPGIKNLYLKIFAYLSSHDKPFKRQTRKIVKHTQTIHRL